MMVHTGLIGCQQFKKGRKSPQDTWERISTLSQSTFTYIKGSHEQSFPMIKLVKYRVGDQPNHFETFFLYIYSNIKISREGIIFSKYG